MFVTDSFSEQPLRRTTPKHFTTSPCLQHIHLFHVRGLPTKKLIVARRRKTGHSGPANTKWDYIRRPKEVTSPCNNSILSAKNPLSAEMKRTFKSGKLTAPRAARKQARWFGGISTVLDLIFSLNLLINCSFWVAKRNCRLGQKTNCARKLTLSTGPEGRGSFQKGFHFGGEER